ASGVMSAGSSSNSSTRVSLRVWKMSCGVMDAAYRFGAFWPGDQAYRADRGWSIGGGGGLKGDARVDVGAVVDVLACEPEQIEETPFVAGVIGGIEQIVAADARPQRLASILHFVRQLAFVQSQATFGIQHRRAVRAIQKVV